MPFPDKLHRLVYPEFTSIPLFNDEMVLVASKKHPRISGPLLESDVYNEQHAVVSLERFASFSQPWQFILHQLQRLTNRAK